MRVAFIAHHSAVGNRAVAVAQRVGEFLAVTTALEPRQRVVMLTQQARDI